MESHEDYGLTITSPEISKKDKFAAAQAFKICIDALEIIRKQGLHTAKSIADAEAELAQEHIGVNLEALSEDELQPALVEESESKPESLPEPEKDVIQSKLNWELPSNQKE